jgi:hypothetical protein
MQRREVLEVFGSARYAAVGACAARGGLELTAVDGSSHLKTHKVVCALAYNKAARIAGGEIRW